MNTTLFSSLLNKRLAKGLSGGLFVVLLVICNVSVLAQDPASTPTPLPEVQDAPTTPSDQDAPKIPGDQLDSLVAPVALYPDPLLSQVLVSST
jgi:hypothetical protein